MKIFTIFITCIVAVLLLTSTAYAQLINGKPTIHVPKNRLQEARELLMQNPDAAAALRSGELQISPDLASYSAFDYLSGKPVPSRLDYPNPNNPRGYDSVSGQDNIKNKLEELKRGLQKPDSPQGQPPKQQSEVICIPPRPGQDPQNGIVTDEKLPGDPTRDTNPPVLESELNFQLRKLGSATQQEEIIRATTQIVESGKVKLAAIPDSAQSQEFVASLEGNSKGQGVYTINGVKVQAGKKYRANVADPETGVTFDENCKPTQGTVPDPGKENPGGGANPGFGDLGGNPGGGDDGGGNDGGGGFGGGGDGGGGLFGGDGGGGLAALLPLLMQGLLGGGQQGQQGQGQNQYGAGYGNNQQLCISQPVAPVCGTDGKTYNNDCYRAMYTSLRSSGVCPIPSPSPSLTPSPNISASPTPRVDVPDSVRSVVTLTQLSQSGIPASLLENVRGLVTTVLSQVISGKAVSETVVR